MPEMPLSEFHAALRALLGDGGDEQIGYDFEAAQLNGALQFVVQGGFLPCLRLTVDKTKLVDSPPNPDTWGFLVAKAAHVLVGGERPISYKTRALSTYEDPAARRDSLTFIETMLSDIDARGNLCGTADDTGHNGLFGTMQDLATYCQVGGCLLPPDLFPCHG